jgi:hypothetical protein
MTKSLFSTTPVTTRHSNNAPVIVVGLPRSGSSFLSHVLSQIPDWYVFDDLYLQDKARELSVDGPILPAQMDKLLFFLGWQIRARLRFGSYAIPNMAEPEVEEMNKALKACYINQEITWPQLQKEWMVRLAHRSGCKNWGYKMPKAFRSLPFLFKNYPEAKIIYLLRQPHDVLRSFKFISPDNQDGHPDRYHALFYALYWRLAARSYRIQSQKNPNQVMLITFSELTQDTQDTAERLANFLNVKEIGQITKPERPNSSFSDKGPRNDLTGLEYWLIDILCGSEIDRLGFERRKSRIRFRDFADFLARSYRFVRFKLTAKRN